MRRSPTQQQTPTARQVEIDQAILQALATQERPNYQTLARAAGTSKSQVKASWQRLAAQGLATPPDVDQAELTAYAAGWDAAVGMMGNPEV
jgi:DNA-binding IclR family transcriptional regulator